MTLVDNNNITVKW